MQFFPWRIDFLKGIVTCRIDNFFPISGDCYNFKLASPLVFATLSVHVSELVPFSYLGATEAPLMD